MSISFAGDGMGMKIKIRSVVSDEADVGMILYLSNLHTPHIIPIRPTLSPPVSHNIINVFKK